MCKIARQFLFLPGKERDFLTDIAAQIFIRQLVLLLLCIVVDTGIFQAVNQGFRRIAGQSCHIRKVYAPFFLHGNLQGIFCRIRMSRRNVRLYGSLVEEVGLPLEHFPIIDFQGAKKWIRRIITEELSQFFVALDSSMPIYMFIVQGVQLALQACQFYLRATVLLRFQQFIRCIPQMNGREDFLRLFRRDIQLLMRTSYVIMDEISIFIENAIGPRAPVLLLLHRNRQRHILRLIDLRDGLDKCLELLLKRHVRIRDTREFRAIRASLMLQCPHDGLRMFIPVQIVIIGKAMRPGWKFGILVQYLLSFLQNQDIRCGRCPSRLESRIGQTDCRDKLCTACQVFPDSCILLVHRSF